LVENPDLSMWGWTIMKVHHSSRTLYFVTYLMTSASSPTYSQLVLCPSSLQTLGHQEKLLLNSLNINFHVWVDSRTAKLSRVTVRIMTYIKLKKLGLDWWGPLQWEYHSNPGSKNKQINKQTTPPKKLYWNFFQCKPLQIKGKHNPKTINNHLRFFISVLIIQWFRIWEFFNKTFHY
jgi:hypothetical protein